eukprot:m.125765 g.125765  ORF g.125765 m.125765 type:complete len:938 (+) comp13811_c0_seq2:98-2911(+)
MDGAQTAQAQSVVPRTPLSTKDNAHVKTKTTKRKSVPPPVAPRQKQRPPTKPKSKGTARQEQRQRRISVASARVNFYDDLARIAPLNEDAVLSCIKERFNSGIFYSEAGPTLVALNPYTLGAYAANDIVTDATQTSPNMLSDVSSDAPEFDRERPHLNSIARRALTNASHEKAKEQIIVLSGQSGAGKTFSTNAILKYLTHHDAGEAHELADKITSSGPVLEAFGNARTINNANSSRFGKFIALHLSQGNIVGATIEAFLLEKSRVTHSQSHEQNFHVFHAIQSAILSGNDSSMLTGLTQEHCCISTFLPKHGEPTTKVFSLDGICSSMTTVGIKAAHQHAIIQAVCGIIQLGCLDLAKFCENPMDQHQNGFVEAAAKSLQLSFAQLTEFILKKKRVVGTDTILTDRTPQEATSTVIGFCRFVYNRLFTAIVRNANASLGAAESAQRLQQPGSNTIGLLDIFGFESCEENSLEQLCINFTNEKLQRHYVTHMIEAEWKLYQAEGLGVAEVPMGDTAMCLDAIAGKGSVFSILTEQCRLKLKVAPSPAKLTSLFQEALRSNSAYNTAKSSHQFVLKHYAGPVVYTASSLLSKNQDVHFTVYERVLGDGSECSTEPSLCTLLMPENQPASAVAAHRGKGRKAKVDTVAATFVHDMAKLFERLGRGAVHYIRCISSNKQGLAHTFSDEDVLNQLRTGGIIHSLQVFAEGRPVHIKYTVFANCYAPLLRLVKGENSPESASAAENLKECVRTTIEMQLNVASLSHDQRPLFGRTRVFLKDSQVTLLNERLAILRGRAATQIQAFWRKVLAQESYSNIRKQVVKLQAIVRMTIALRHTRNLYQKWLTVQRLAQEKEAQVQMLKATNAFVTAEEVGFNATGVITSHATIQRAAHEPQPAQVQQAQTQPSRQEEPYPMFSETSNAQPVFAHSIHRHRFGYMSLS